MFVCFGHACNIRPFGWHASQCSHGFILKWHGKSFWDLSHSFLELKLIRYGWGISLVDVGQVSKRLPMSLKDKAMWTLRCMPPKGSNVASMPKANKHDWGGFLPHTVYTRAVHGSGLCPTRTRPDFIGWEKSLTRNRPGQSFGSVGSGRIGFGSVSVGFGFAWVERNLTGFWPKCGLISLDLVRSNKIWPIFSYNYKDQAEILMDLVEICL